MIAITLEVEPDLHTGTYLGITEGLKRLIKILDKYNVKSTFFTTCDCIEKYPKIFQKLKKQGHEIALHAYEHKTFTKLSYNKKKKQIKDSMACFKKYLNQHPNGFRAPQHLIDQETLDLLEEHGFVYDSSYLPLNILQFIFSPKNSILWVKNFFTSTKRYKIRKNLYEIPPTAILIPFMSIIFRAFSKKQIIYYYNFLKVFNRNIIFDAHSWDFIDTPGKISKKWPKEKLLENLDHFLKYTHKKNKFCRLIDLKK